MIRMRHNIMVRPDDFSKSWRSLCPVTETAIVHIIELMGAAPFNYVQSACFLNGPVAFSSWGARLRYCSNFYRGNIGASR